MEDRRNKLVIVINGKGGVGKDAFCDAAAGFWPTRNVSAITPVKEIAAQCGWDGGKDLKSRKFLADLKQLLSDYNGLPNAYLEGEYRAFLDSGEMLMFAHIREAEQINDFLRRLDGPKVTLLVRSKRVDDARYGNAADDLAEAYPYDYVFHNDGPLQELPGAVHSFLFQVLKEQGLSCAGGAPSKQDGV